MQIIKNMFIILFVLSITAFGQSDGPAEIVKAKSFISLDKLAPDIEAKIALQINIAKGWHINSDKPNEDFLIPSELKILSPGNIVLTEVIFPAAKNVALQVSDKPLSVFENEFFLGAKIKTLKDLPLGLTPIIIEFSYQGCDDHTCMAPSSFIDTFNIEVISNNSIINEINTEIFSKIDFHSEIESKSNTEPQTDAISSTLEGGGFLLGLILIFLAGLALNLTPCVYPLIPITIGFFGGQSEGKTSKLALMGALYVLGLAITYSAIGVITSLSGAVFGALLQNPIVIIVIAGIFIALALSMFGVYEFKLPDSLVAKAGGAKTGYFGAFFMGLTMGIVAAPCVGPFVISLVTFVASQGDPLIGFILFFVLALGLGTPYFLLAIFSGKIKNLPRAGAWMDSVKHIFGLIMLGMAIYFLIPLLPKSISGYVLPVYMIIAVIYLVFIDKSSVGNKGFQTFKYIFSIIILAVAVYLLIPSNEENLQWQKYSESSFIDAKSNGKAIILDFYADWCIPCKELDAITFSDQRVIDATKDFLLLKVDMTKSLSPEVEALRNKFNIIGVPTVIIINAEGKEINRITGFVPADEFLKLLE